VSRESDGNIQRSLPTPSTGIVVATDCHPLTAQLPRYLVDPISIPVYCSDHRTCVKILNFGQACLNGKQREIHCHLAFRAPETILTSLWNVKIDIWSLGCRVHPSLKFIAVPQTDRRKSYSSGLSGILHLTISYLTNNFLSGIGYQQLETHPKNGETTTTLPMTSVSSCGDNFPYSVRQV